MKFGVPFNFLRRPSTGGDPTDTQPTAPSEAHVEDSSPSHPAPDGGVVENIYGLKMIDDRHCSSEVSDGVDIIAVHGLGGGYRDTWTHLVTGKFWLKDFLADQLNTGDRPIKARILSFGYDANTLFTASNLDVDIIARILLDRIQGRRQGDAEQKRPIVFIAHSLGGIVVKKCMNYANERESEYGEVLDKIHGIIFFAVPHRGSGFADWPSAFLRAPESLHFPRCNAQLVTALQKESTQFFTISNAWVERSASLRITSFCETLKPIVVDEQSSTLNIGNEIPIPLGNSSHTSICKFAGPEDENFDSVLMKLREICSAALKLGSKKRMEEAHPPQQIQQAIEDGNRQELIESLSFPEMLNRRENIQAPHRGTCEWILHHETYKAWLHDEHGLLSIKGPPGSGISVLMSFLFEEWVQQDSADQVVRLHHFFNRRGVELQHSMTGMLRSLVWQLYDSHPAASSQLDTSFKQKRKLNPRGVVIWSAEQLKSGFLQALDVVAQSAPISIFIDALDEADPQDFDEIIGQVHRIHDKFARTGAPVKICMSSRHYPVAPTNAAREIFVELNNANDIAQLIQYELGLCKQHPDAADDATLQVAALWISSHAKGLFQWVSLVVPLVVNMFKDGRLAELEDLETSLRAIAGDLGGLYSHIVRQTIRQDKVKTSLYLFRFVCHAKRPLSLEELLSALEFSENQGIKSDKSTRGYSQYDEKTAGSLIRSLSGGLIHVVTAKAGKRMSGSESWTLQGQTIHQSVNDFMTADGFQLLESRADIDAPETQDRSAEKRSHWALAEFCLQYIKATSLPQKVSLAQKLPTIDSSPRNIFQLVKYDSQEFEGPFVNRPAIAYAVTNLFEHISRCEKGDFPSSFTMDLCSNFRKWQHIAKLLKSPVKKHGGETLVHSCARYNALGILEHLLKSLEGAIVLNLDSLNNHEMSAMHLAVSNNNVDVIQTLVEAGASTTSPIGIDSPFRTALEGGHVEAARKLIDLTKNPKALCAEKYDCGSCAIVLAISSKRALEMLDLFESVGADPNLRGRWPGFTALEVACICRNEALVEKLLEMGADPNKSKEKDEGPLFIMAWDNDNTTHYNPRTERHAINVAELLLNSSLVVDPEGGPAGNAVAEAIKEGKEQYAAYLSARGATPTIAQLSRALAEKCLWGFEGHSCIASLLRKGALPNRVIRDIIGDPGGPFEHLDAVQASRRNGWEEALAELLAVGASFPDRKWLQWALLESVCDTHGLAVRLLLRIGVDANGAPNSPYSTQAPMTAIAESLDSVQSDWKIRIQLIARVLIEAGAAVTEEQRAKIYPEGYVPVGAEFEEVDWEGPLQTLSGPGRKAILYDCQPGQF